MEKIFLLLVMALSNSTETTVKPNPMVETPHAIVSRESEMAPEIRTNIIPRITTENHRQFIPTVYGDATTIGFSNGISFDTKYLGKSGEPNLPNELKYEYRKNETGYYIVQFAVPIYQAQRDWLTASDAAIHFYIPHYGFVCSIRDQASKEEIRAHPSVKWVGVYQPAYKISALFDMVGEEHKVTILLFMDADIAAILEDIKDITKRSEFTISDNGINKMIQGVISKRDINSLARINGIYWIEPYIQPQFYNADVQWILQDAEYNVRNIWNKGIAGEGEIVNTLDSGINTNHYAHRSGSTVITTWGYYPTHNAIVAYDSGASEVIQFGDGGVRHGTHTAGTLTGDDTLTAGGSNRDGIAKKAKIYFLDGGPNTGNSIYTFGDLNDCFIRPYDRYYPPTRAHISSHSWGSDANGAYTSNCLNVDQFMWDHKDFLLFFSNGNAGSGGKVGAPAAAKNCVSVGGCRNGSTGYTQYYSTTSRGPTADGRYKPTVLSPATQVYSSTSGTNTYGSLSGTSMACPGAAGAGALTRQYLREGWYPTGKKTTADSFPFISASLVKAILINCADPNVASYTVPDNNIGWGRINLDSTLYFEGEARKILLVDNTIGLLTGEQVDYHFSIPSGAANLKIALVWTDYPGNPAVLRQIVNDIDLSAYIGAHYYRGNQYSGGQSIEDPAGRDSVNVEECIRVNTPAEGDCRVTIEARNVPCGPQPFSLVITYNAGSVAGVVSLDKPAYKANDFMVDTVHIRIEDTNYGSATTVDSVLATISGNLIETEPESIWCRELAESAYVFKGGIPLLFNREIHGDGQLSVGQGDTITVSYADANPSYTSTTWATVDAYYFIISDVHCENIEAAAAEVCWMTNENANSTVHYGTDPGNLNQTAAMESLFCIPHRVKLTGLQSKTTYYYDVESEDFRGNKVFDNNGGQHYSFTTKASGGGVDVMVVVLNSDGFDDAFIHGDFLTDALDEGGWTYNWWQTKSDGDFSRDMLKNYKAVYFQVGQTGGSGGNYPVWTVAQKETIKVYHNGGARFGMTGFDIGWDPWENSPSADTNFCKDYLHFHYEWDIVATTWDQLFGMPGDPISGDYTSGEPYSPFRQGAAGDGITLSGTGAPGTGSYVWHGEVANDSCAIKWESQNTMGTPGNGVWGGEKTRVVTNAFEITQIDTTDPNSPTRPDILNKMFIWLIGHDHPDATINSPVGGNTYTTSPITIEWDALAHGGASIDTTWVEYSHDAGNTWVTLASGPGIISPFDWDVNNLQNNARYQVKVTVGDKDVYPSMKGFDVTENFTINIPGNDDLGPTVIPQSIIMGANPMIVTATNNSLPFSAVVSDSFSGLSQILSAEWSIGSNPDDPGDGAAMSVLDGTFDEVLETVVDTLRFEYIPGETQICSLWIRGQDAASARAQNWGNALMRTFTVIDGQAIGISESGEVVPISYALSSPLPNPFLRNVTIYYGIPKTKKVTLKVYNCLGQVVQTLVDGIVEPGFYTIHWDGRDDLNRKVSAGVYFYRLLTDDYTGTKKMVMIK